MGTIDKGENKMFGFDAALIALKTGLRVQRKGWNGKGMWLVLAYQTDNQKKDAAIKFNKEYDDVDIYLSNFIAMKTADNRLVPWLASQTDLLAEDWVIYE